MFLGAESKVSVETRQVFGAALLGNRKSLYTADKFWVVKAAHISHNSLEHTDMFGSHTYNFTAKDSKLSGNPKLFFNTSGNLIG